MGTCIGKRNTRYFVLFLFNTGMHSLVTFIICLLFLLTNGWDALKAVMGEKDPGKDDGGGGGGGGSDADKEGVTITSFE